MKLRIKKSRKEGKRVLSLAGEISIYTVLKLKEIIVGELESEQGVELELSEVDRIDTAGFQLLLYFRREGDIAGKGILLNNVSEAVESIFSFYRESYQQGV